MTATCAVVIAATCAVLSATTWSVVSAATCAVGGLFLGAGYTTYNINQISLRQAIVPIRLHGRMNASVRFLVWGTMPVGALVGGALGTAIGLRAALLDEVHGLIERGGVLATLLSELLTPTRSYANDDG